ncbi:precorrin-2 dehydrogenase/sirohydrochlorin ferrochelatase family protein [Bacillus atrophaeus]|uniref:precorrin-2 dehydrogenase/sirohydrochlorin ferrochelatase family protein n=1 Tax=Bacillus atrophaeus TaxID=1452 RepID=UPI002DB7BB0A|nr:bifunctional precorrin-2 dehydrogenase/sirohydrochlorin ferrochelatase [Bacillus atrophaeus]MEC0767309.1 bifunctional precorrin-2 dehydrogenase/sirohydrochlorin ferrochelatase [Bacillus atrophaeus]MEC0779629.1 bifunctional precorrin-2 dehydrogenase/sirohydrochlorin ferrochelatase [Bacillus atrophaeus]MEC0809044.1 bifunctional precorrin-2 dehydrogenase/sirohydrochlorin ferrochelatase [Bacillus atrophaeus]
MLPLHISLRDRKVVIAGGGKIALRRVKTVLTEGADITLISPHALPEIKVMAEEHQIRWIPRKIDQEDLREAFLIIAATDDPDVNEQIAKNASPSQLVNCVSAAELGNVYMPKIVQKGHIKVSVSTNGASPKHTKLLAEKIDQLIDEECILEVERLYKKRRNT